MSEITLLQNERKFDFEAIKKQLFDRGAVVATDDSNMFSFPLTTDETFAFSSKDRGDISHPAHKSPAVDLGPYASPPAISCGVNWSDSNGNSLRSFLEYIMEEYTPVVRDNDTGLPLPANESTDAFRYWVKTWLVDI